MVLPYLINVLLKPLVNVCSSCIFQVVYFVLRILFYSSKSVKIQRNLSQILSLNILDNSTIVLNKNLSQAFFFYILKKLSVLISNVSLLYNWLY